MQASAEGEFLDLSLSGFSCGEPLISDEVNEMVDEFEKNDANMAEKFLAGQTQNLWHIGDINGMNSLVFGNPYCIWAGEGTKMAADGVFTESERKVVIEPMLKLFSSLFVLMLMLAMMISGLKTSLNGIRGQGMAELGEDAKMWFFAGFFILCYDIFLNVIFQLNAAIVLSVKDLVANNGVSLDQFSMMATGDSVTNVMAFIFVALAEWVLALILNFVYIARKVIIMLLIMLGYVAAYSLLFAKTRAFFGVWVKELVGNVFLQSIHALVFYGMVMFAAQGAGVIFKMGLMLMFIPVSGMISKWLNIGDSSSKLGSSLTMMGLGGVMSTMMLASQASNILRGGNVLGGNAMSGDSVMSNTENSLSTLAGSTSMLSSLANDASPTSISTEAKGWNSEAFTTTKNALSQVGGFTGAAAGMIAGPAGMALGYKAGSGVTGALLQTGRNAAFGFANIHSQISNAKNYTGAGGEGFKALMGDAVARRQFFGNLGEAAGGIVGLHGVGRNAGLAMSGISRDVVAHEIAQRFGMTDENGNLIPATFQNLSAQYPGANVKFLQTNEGSGFYIDTGNGWQQVGATGAADSVLRAGEMRVVDYKLADPSVPYQLQANGTYNAPIAAMAASTTMPNEQFESLMHSPPLQSAASAGIPIQMQAQTASMESISAGGNSPFISEANAQVSGENWQGINTTMPLDNGSPFISAANVQMPSNNGQVGNLSIPAGDVAPILSGTGVQMPGANNQTDNPSIPMGDVAPILSGGGVQMPSTNGQVGNASTPLGEMSANTTIPIGQPPVQPVTPTSFALPGGNNSTVMPLGAAPVQPNTTVVSSNLGTDKTPSSGQSLSEGPIQSMSLSDATAVKNGPVKSQLAGLQGSTPTLMRTSNAYIVGGATENGRITQQTFATIAQPTTQRFETPQFKAANINPDAYVYTNASRFNGSTDNNEKMDNTSPIKSRWFKKYQEQKQESRSKISGL